MQERTTMAGSRSVAVALLVLMALAMAPRVTATSYVVGGAEFGWSAMSILGPGFGGIPKFFQKWAARNSPFHTTDEVVFIFDSQDSVLQVSFADFTECNTQHPIKSWLSTGAAAKTTVRFSLANSKFSSVYFISGQAGHCAGGQEVYINVFE